MGGLCEDYVFLLQGSLSTCSTALPPCVYVYVCVFVPVCTRAPLHAACLLNVTQAPSSLKPACLAPCAVHFK